MLALPRRLAQKLILSLTVIVVIIAAVSGLISVKTQERQLLDAMIRGADQLSKSITSATWHAMLADHREDAYRVMQTIALKQGIEQIRMFNREGRLMFSTRGDDPSRQLSMSASVCKSCHSSLEPKVQLSVKSRAQIVRETDGRRNLTMVTPIYNEPACSQAACHAHPKSVKVLGVLDLALNLETVDARVGEVQYRVAAETFIEVVLIGVFILFFTRHFVSRPIGSLVAATRNVTATNLDEPVQLKSGSQEIDELAHSFDEMRERLRLAVGEINQMAATLEGKVEERTRQLATAHQKLLQSDRLASLGQLAASVAHEINNPIAGVLNLSMLLQRILKEDGIPPERVGDFRKYLGQVINETTRVGRIVSDLLAFSRRSKPQRTMADLNKIVQATLSLASHKLKLGNVEVKLDLAPDLPSVPCDPSQMQQVALNLVLNGAEATHPKGQGTLLIRTRFDQTHVFLSVTDDGEGIPKENLAKIFDPFFTTKPEGKGVGLGLAVLYGIVQSHGGDVEVTSQPGLGATFTVSLPLAQAAAGTAA